MGAHSTPSSSSTASLEPYSASFKPFSGKLTLAVSFSRVAPAEGASFAVHCMQDVQST